MCSKMIIILFALVLFSVLSPPAVADGSDRIFARSNYARLQEPRPTTDSGSAQIYKERCVMCHDRPKDRIPPRSLIARQASEDVIRALTTGTMKQWTDGLTADQIRALGGLSQRETAERAGSGKSE